MPFNGTQRHKDTKDDDYDDDYDFLSFVLRLSFPRPLQTPLLAPLLLKEGAGVVKPAIMQGEGWLSSSIGARGG